MCRRRRSRGAGWTEAASAPGTAVDFGFLSMGFLLVEALLESESDSESELDEEEDDDDDDEDDEELDEELDEDTDAADPDLRLVKPEVCPSPSELELSDDDDAEYEACRLLLFLGRRVTGAGCATGAACTCCVSIGILLA